MAEIVLGSTTLPRQTERELAVRILWVKEESSKAQVLAIILAGEKPVAEWSR